MTTQPVSNHPQAPAPTPVRLKLLPFAFPFLRKGQGQSEANARFTDEHEIYRLLAGRETGGGYLVSPAGLWHGGIHVSEAGTGQSLDLDAGLRCIADGVLIAFRADRTYPVSELTPAGGAAAVRAPYSTGFALVQHTMEFPRGTKLTFYSLYMHLMSYEDYGNFPRRAKPGYWPRVWEITEFARDTPSAGPAGQVADPAQRGLRVRRTHPHGAVIGIVPQGTGVSIGMKEGGWGQLADLHGATLHPRVAGGYADPSQATGGWIFMGTENGGPVVREKIADSTFDRVVIAANAAQPGAAQGIPVKAGDLMGHLGRYDSLNQGTTGTRMAHIEVFCDDGIQSFLEQGRAWINQHSAHKEDWTALGLPSEPTILRIEPGTVLYQRNDQNRFVAGADPESRKTDAVQVYSLAELARDPQRRVAEAHPNPDPGYPVSWWHVDGVNAQGQAIDGWVLDFNFPGGRVTREFAQKWVDFQCVEETHDAAHTVFATTQEWVAYQRPGSGTGTAARLKLSPLMLKVYDALFTRGDGQRAADELCTLSRTMAGGYPWLMQTASRLIVKHESEWANPAKWKQLTAALEQESGEEGRAQHQAEQARIEKLVWWDEVKAGVTGFPAPGVYHVNPLAIAGNFAIGGCSCGKPITMDELKAVLPEDVRQYGLFYKANCESVRNYPAQDFLMILNKNLEKYGIIKCLHKAHFLSQFSHECDQLRTNEEYKNKNGIVPTYWDNYHGGRNYHGRGLIQITHDYNYRNYGVSIGNPQIYVNPDIVSSEVEHTIESACWYWRSGSAWGDVNPKAERSDFLAVTIAVNGGYRHVVERNKLLIRLAALLKLSACFNASGVKLNNFRFSESAVHGSAWHADHTMLCERVENSLSIL